MSAIRAGDSHTDAASALIEVGMESPPADPESLAAMLRAFREVCSPE